MRLHELITETLDSDIDYTVVASQRRLFTTRATIAGRDIIFSAESRETGTDIQPVISWYIDFMEKTPGKISFKKTGRGAELQVFSFVLRSIEELVARYSPDIIKFESDKASGNRTRLYSTMVKRIAPKLGYMLDKIDTDEHNDMFVLKKV
jgi:hypothetical protein